MQNFIYKQVDDGTFCVTEYTGDEPHVEIPDTWCGKPITMLYDDLFKGHGEILSVRIPDTVREIGGFVFDGCVNLRAVTLPRSLEEMWQYAFARSGIEEIVLPDGMRSVVAFTFFGCRQLRKVTCGSGLRKIRARAFLGCDALKEVIHGEAVEVSPLAKKISLDDSIVKYIPDFSDERVTIRHLLTHTSAISGYIKNRNQLSGEELLVKLHQLKVQDWFEKEVVYTDTGLIFLGEIIEYFYNDSVQNIITKEVLEPLGLKNSTFSPDPKKAVPTELQENGKPLRGIVHDPKAQILKEHCGSAGLFMNLEDMVRFTELMLGNIIEDEVILQDTIKLLNKDYTPNGELGRSLGWDLKTSKNKHLCIYHTGFTGTFVVIDRFCGNALVVLTNRIHPTRENKTFLERRDEIVDMFLEQN